MKELSSTTKVVLLAVIIILMIVGVTFGVIFSENKNLNKRSAVFLSNGQVYFGYIKSENRDNIVLTDIFYLKSPGAIQEGSGDKKISLIKLGSEIHGPESEMRINRNHLLYYEYMKNDSKINQAIERSVTKR